MRSEIVELTNKLYRQTLLFPKKEPLRYKIREIADDILEKIVEWEVLNSPNPGEFFSGGISKKKDLIFEIEKDLELVKSFFNVVKWQNWVSYFDIIRIEEEYNKIGDYFKIQTKDLIQIKEKPIKERRADKPKILLDSRKRKILDILKDREKAQVGEIKEIMPDISKRTLRRDFDVLLKEGLVQRAGESNSTYYKLS